MKFLLLTDSVSLPRKYDGGEVLWEDIYFKKLQQHFSEHEFVLVAMGGATITQLHLALNYYTQLKPDVIILQSGIVDCAPRALTQFELQLVTKLHLFRLVYPYTNFLRKVRKISYTKLPVFESTLLKIKSVFSEKPLISIGILPGCDEYDKKVPGISDRINQYNSVLNKHTIFIDNKDFPRHGIINDFHHLNEVGQAYMFQQLLPVLEKMIGQKNP